MKTIDITGVDLVKFAQKIYELSRAAGMGMLHFRPGSLSEEDARECITNSASERVVLNMDYVHGRGCKMTVWREKGKLLIGVPWFDHTDYQLQQLLAAFGIKLPEGKTEHNLSCACSECEAVRHGRDN